MPAPDCRCGGPPRYANMNDLVWSDTMGMLGWLLVPVAAFVILLVLFKLLLWWLAKHPQIARIFAVVFTGFAGAILAGVAAALFTFLKYGFRGGTQILGMDRGAFIILAACSAGFLLGAALAFLFVRRIVIKPE